MGEIELKNWEDSTLKNTSWHFWTIRNQPQGTKRIINFSNFPQKRNFLNLTLMEEIKPVVAHGDDFDCRDKWKYITYFRIFLYEFLMRGKTQRFDLSMDLHKFWFIGRDQVGRFQNSSYRELGVSIPRENILHNIIWNNRLSVFQCKEENWQKNTTRLFLQLKSFWLTTWNKKWRL